MKEFLDQIKSFSPKRLALLAAELKENLDRVQAAAREPIAIVGIGCRFPGADGPEAYWKFLKEGRDGIRDVPSDRWSIDEYFDPDPDAPGKIATRYGGFLEQISAFDANFFGIAPREALNMDPQQRLLLEVGWEALEHAGIAASKLATKRVGVFVGICNNDYLQLLLTRGEKAIDAYLASGNALSVAAGRLSYVLGFQGPSMSIDTSCSASLVAIHAACQSLRTGESGLAIAGGVNIICAPETYVALSRAHMLARDGRCKTFDASADGFGRAEGCGMVVLKRLSDAQRDGDRIIALVRGTAINQDGRSGGLTVPNGPAQESVIRDALTTAGLSSQDIKYVEAHGTGTSLGDPIEVRALSRALGERRKSNDPLWIGSVKSNFGHLESAAGIAGFIKVALALENKEVPPSLHFNNPNPNIDWQNLPIKVVTQHCAWPDGVRRYAGVSSFGFSGTNAHAVLEEAPAVAEAPAGVDRPLHCLPLSAASESALSELAHRYVEAIKFDESLQLADVAHTAAVGRAHLKHRAVAVVADAAEARSVLQTIATGGADPRIHRGIAAPDSENDVVFLYTGAGAQYPGMGQALYSASPIFRDVIDRCDEILGADSTGRTLKSVMRMTEDAEPAIHNIEWTQPALFSIECALTELWRSWGIDPAAVIGHSVGEYAAAYAAGVFSLEEGLNLIARRGRLLQSVSRGGMMAAVFAPVQEVAAAIAPVAHQVAIAAVNAPENVVISGETQAVEAILGAFKSRNINAQQLYVSLAAHSPMVDPALDEMEALARSVSMSPPKIPVAWNLVGGPLPGGASPDALYWRRHMREPVRFADGIKSLHNDGYRIYLEVGPHPTLLALAQQNLSGSGARFLTSLRRGKDDWSELLGSLAELHVRGVQVDWEGVDRPYSRRRIALPTYPFERERFWAAPYPAVARGQRNIDAPKLKSPLENLFYKVEWEAAKKDVGRLPAPSQINDGAHEYFDALAREHRFSIYDDLMPALDRLSLAYIKSAFRMLGFDETPGRRVSAAAECAHLKVANRHHQLFGTLLKSLAEHELLELSADGFIVGQAWTRDDPDLLCKELLARFRDADSELELLQRCGPELARILRGEQDPLPLLFTQGSFTALRKLYADSPYAQTYNNMLAELVRRATSRRNGAPVRVIEIGAGTGSTTGFVLPIFGKQVEYTFTDISPLFLAQAKEQFSEYPRLATAVLDIERDPQAQGFNLGSYDVVIAANVLHATTDMLQTMANVSRLLAPGGLLFLGEAVKSELWTKITFGLTEGWWRFSDTARRKESPLLDCGGWRRLLEESNFVDVSLCPNEANARGPSASQVLITAQRSREKLSRRWLVLADSDDSINQFGIALADSGDELRVVPPTIWCRAAKTGFWQQEWWPTPGYPTEIVYLGALDEHKSHDSDLDEFFEITLNLLKAAADERGVRVWLVTRGSQDVRGIRDVVAPEQASIWGLGRTFALEHPDQWGGLIDLDPFNSTELAQSIIDTVRANDGEDQSAWRDGMRLLARIMPMAAPSGSAKPLRADVSYLVTGGLGGLGIEIAKWLASRGAQHIVLTSRSAMPARSEWSAYGSDRRVAGITELERLGTAVETAAVDVGEPAEMGRLMSRFGSDWPPLGGIVHAAVAPTAATLADMEPDVLTAMYRTKVKGAQLLGALSDSQPIEFFIMFSTTTAILGSAKLAHYAASNAVVDALACRGRAQGKPMLSINWGTWDTMLSASEQEQAQIVRGGLHPISVTNGFAALESLLAANATRAIVADVDWPVLRDVYEVRRSRPILSCVATASKSTGGEGLKETETTTLSAEIDLALLRPDQRHDAIETGVRRDVAQVLGLRAPEGMDPTSNLFKLGLDSLMAIDLKGRLERLVGASLPSALAFNYPTITALVGFLENTLAERSRILNEVDDTSDLLSKLPEMSGADLDALLAKMLPGEENRA